MTERLFPVPEGLVGERADLALTRLLGISRARAAQLLADGFVTLDGRGLGKSDRLSADGLLAVTATEIEPTGAAVVPMQVPGMQVLFDDRDLVVVDKPAGVAAHPSPGWVGPTVLGGLAGAGINVSALGAAERQGIVHRLDVGTSGLMVVAKSDLAYRELKEQFRDRLVHKVYQAVVQGHLDPLVGTIDAPVGRHPTADYRFAVTAQGRPSITHYRTLEAHRHGSLLEIELETGRTHQIRVHMSALRHPCVGDLTYGADPSLARRLGLQRQWLHAVRLGFTHPGTGQAIEFTSEPAADLQEGLVRLRAGVGQSG
ncbi:MAG: RluA family pseudouridine synthase [Actinomycetales bacterium]|nr:RluA family pseudouridine synthase [Actinomycetales bacterium]